MKYATTAPTAEPQTPVAAGLQRAAHRQPSRGSPLPASRHVLALRMPGTTRRARAHGSLRARAGSNKDHRRIPLCMRYQGRTPSVAVVTPRQRRRTAVRPPCRAARALDGPFRMRAAARGQAADLPRRGSGVAGWCRDAPTGETGSTVPSARRKFCCDEQQALGWGWEKGGRGRSAGIRFAASSPGRERGARRTNFQRRLTRNAGK